jgi:SnoaL-like domain
VAVVSGFDATQHLTGPVLVTWSDGHRATCATTVRGYHHIVADHGDSGIWMVSGQYQLGLDRGPDRWKISAITLTLAYDEGDRGLVDVGRHRAQTESAGRTGRR